VPYSLCFDDSYRNKVLVHADENRQKGNRLPLQYLKGVNAEKFKVWVNASVRDFRKKQKLLKERFTEEEQKEFKERNLTDTKYISSLLYNFINDNLEFAPTKTGRIKRVQTVNGSITSYMQNAGVSQTAGRW
jgi:CRISPR-associated endonuclease Csn1